MLFCLRRYDEANKHYDAILQDDPTNTVRPERGRISLFSVCLYFTLRSQLVGIL